MTIKITKYSNQVVPYTSLTFSGGEEHVKIDPEDVLGNQCFTIHAAITSAKDVLQLMMVKDALQRSTNEATINLNMPYIPYARQDRVCNPGEALSIRVFCDLINSIGFDEIRVLMPHSDVATALLNNVDETFHQERWDAFVAENIIQSDHERLVIVSPDAGAMKRTLKFAQYYNNEVTEYDEVATPVVMADKVRDVTNGKIVSTTVHATKNDLDGKSCLIYDDICDGGMTFIKLAEALRERGASRVILAVPHGIFSKGLGAISKVIDQVITTNTFVDKDMVLDATVCNIDFDVLEVT